MSASVLSFAAALRRSHKAGFIARLQDLPCEAPTYEDADLRTAWYRGYEAATREIEESNE